jgi:hypothetical protein
MILCKTPGRVEVKMSLSETNWWLWKGGETTCGTEGKTSVKHMMKTFDETCMR